MNKVDTLSSRLGQLMQERSLSYKQLSQLTGKPAQTLNRYVLGQREPKAVELTEIAVALGVHPLWLQGYDVPERLDSEALPAPGKPLIPILGTIRAGIPTLAEQEILGYEAADVPANGTYFFLKVLGDSMRGAGIHTGDLVLIRQQADASDGDIVACMVDGQDATLKRFHRQGDWIILQPENPGYAPRLVPVSDFAHGQARILGVAVRLVRQLNANF